MKENDAYACVGKFTVTTELREDVFALGNTTMGVLIEVWRDEKGDFRRPFWQPAIVAYDYETMEKLYEAWPQPDGSLGNKDIESPGEIYYTETGARMVWYDYEDKVHSVHHIDPNLRDLGHGESFRKAWVRAIDSDDDEEPTSFEKNVPSPLSLILER